MSLVLDEYTLVPIHRPAGIICRCTECHKTLKVGTWAIGINLGRDQFYVGTPTSCCGQAQRVARFFKNEGEARIAATEILKVLDRERSARSLNLHPLTSLVTEAL